MNDVFDGELDSLAHSAEHAFRDLHDACKLRVERGLRVVLAEVVSIVLALQELAT